MSESTEPVVTETEPNAQAPESSGLAALRVACGKWLMAADEDGPEMRVQVMPDALPEVCRYLRDDPGQVFDYPADLIALDTGAEIHVVYRVHALATGRTAIVEVRLDRDDPAVPTLYDVWPGFNWFEREAYDLYGIVFDGHPNQGDSTRMRILLPKDWEGFPFRKDYEPEFTDNPLYGPQRTN